MKKEKIIVTSALPYVNGIKHLGNIVGSLLPADIFHRFLDLFGIENIYICGTDEHGAATEIAALEENLGAKEYSDKYYEIQKNIYRKWNFDFTFFGRTSSETHHKTTKEIFLGMHKNGYIKEGEITLPYCKNCERFLPDRFITGVCPHCSYESARGDQCEKCGKVLDPIELITPKCTICGKSEIIFKEEKHLFLDLTKLEGKLKKWLMEKKWPDATKNFALGWIKEGLRQRCITRNLEWGISVPLKGYEHLVFYVWFDAPIGYISITKDAELKGIIKDADKYWADALIYHFIGKDNVPFHTIFWPGTLMAAGRHNLPEYVTGYEFLNWEGKKFSTSKGIGLFSDEALELYPADYWRFYLSRVLPEAKDSNFDWIDFKNRINNELIANYGNLFYRVTSFIEKNFSGKIPEGKTDAKLHKQLKEKMDKIEKLVKNVKLKEALDEALAASSITNKYFQEKKPWEGSADNALYNSANALRIITTMLLPFIPETTEKALSLLGSEKEWSGKFSLKPGQKIKSEILFKKIDDKEIEKAKKYRTKYAKTISEKGIDEEDLDIRVAEITDVKEHPLADKLYVLKIDFGEKRTLVAGIKQFYSKEELKGKKIAVLTNLEEKEIKGVKSNGMILAAGNSIITSGLPKGAVIMQSDKKITIDDFGKHEIIISGNKVLCDGKILDLIPDRKAKEGSRVS